MTEPVISIEFGHTVLDPTNRDAAAIPQAQESARIAEKLIRALDGAGFDIQTVVLLDDKHLSPALDRDKEAALLLESFSLKPDVVVFESDLKLLAYAMVEAIDEPRRTTLARELERRSQRGMQLACSVDITIWQLLRLNLLPVDHDTHRLPPFVRELRSADMAVSILAAHDRTYEERALRENLRSAREFGASRLHNLYVESEEEGFSLSEPFESFTRKIGEKAHV